LVLTAVGVEKLFSRDFHEEIRSQVIESSFAAGAEIHTNYCFGSFFNSVGPGPLAGAKLERNVSFINCCYYLRLRLSSLEATPVFVSLLCDRRAVPFSTVR
jgi:hypothetical protein